MLFLQIILLVTLLAASVFVLFQILQLRDLFPASGGLATAQVTVPRERLQNEQPEQLLQAILSNQIGPLPAPNLVENIVLIRPVGSDQHLRMLIHRLNIYLIAHRFSTPDRTWLRAVVERHLEDRDRLLRYLIFSPLVVGVICQLSEPTSLYGQLHLGALGIGLGLLFTVILQFIYFFSQKELNTRRQAFLDFLQNKLLLPNTAHLEENMASLRNELHQFSKHLAIQIQQLLTAQTDQLSAIQATQVTQIEVINKETAMLEKISQTDFPQIVRFNTETLNALQKTITDFGLFNHLATSLGGLLGTMDSLTKSVSGGLERTGEIKQVADFILDAVRRNTQLEELLVSNIKMLSDRKKQVQDITGGIDEVLSKALKQLGEHTQMQLRKIQDITFRENELLDQSLGKSRERLQKLDRLDELVTEMSSLRKLEEAAQPFALELLNETKQLHLAMKGLSEKLDKKRWF